MKNHCPRVSKTIKIVVQSLSSEGCNDKVNDLRRQGTVWFNGSSKTIIFSRFEGIFALRSDRFYFASKTSHSVDDDDDDGDDDDDDVDGNDGRPTLQHKHSTFFPSFESSRNRHREREKTRKRENEKERERERGRERGSEGERERERDWLREKKKDWLRGTKTK